MPQQLWYPQGLLHLQRGDVDLLNDPIRYALFTPSYTPSEGDEFYSDLANEVVATGYTAGGVLLTTKTITLVDDAAAVPWAASTEYEVSDIVRPTTPNGFVYKCVLAGTSGASEPTWGTVPNRETSDGTLVWLLAGEGFVVFDADDPEWNPSTIDGSGAQFGVIYRGGSAGVDDYVIARHDFGQGWTSQDDVFRVVLHGQGLLRFIRAL